MINAPLAHSGHWSVQLLYLAPMLVSLVFIGWRRWKNRHAAPGDDDGYEPQADDEATAGDITADRR